MTALLALALHVAITDAPQRRPYPQGGETFEFPGMGIRQHKLYFNDQGTVDPSIRYYVSAIGIRH